MKEQEEAEEKKEKEKKGRKGTIKENSEQGDEKQNVKFW